MAGRDYWRADDQPHFMPQFTVTKVLSRRRRQVTYGIEELFVFLVKMIVLQIIFNSKYCMDQVWIRSFCVIRRGGISKSL